MDHFKLARQEDRSLNWKQILIMYVVLSIFCTILFTFIGVIYRMNYWNSIGSAYAPAEELRLVLAVFEFLPLCTFLGFVLSPILACLGKAFYG
jgi:hypothetical protein